MRLLITGATGFVGSNFPDLSQAQIDSFGVDLLPINRALPCHYSDGILQTDINDDDSWEVINSWMPSHVIHLAGSQYTSPPQRKRLRTKVFSENIKLAESISHLCKRVASIKHVTYVSTDMVYGKPSYSDVNESSPTLAIGPYGKSKLMAEDIIKSIPVPSAIVRPRLIIGPGRAGTIQTLGNAMRLGLPIPIIGDGENRYQMISVTDLWSAIIGLASKESNGIFNIGSENPPTLNDLFPKLLHELGAKNKLLHLPRILTESVLRLLDQCGISPLAPEQYEIASLTCRLNTTKLKNEISWGAEDSDLEILISTLRPLLRSKF